MRRAQGGHVVGLDRREHGDAELVASQLAVGLGVDDPVGAQDGGHRRRVDRVGEVDGSDHVAPVLLAGDERGGEVGAVGPGVEDLGRLVAAAGGELRAPVLVEPGHLVLEEEQGGQCRGVVGLVEPRVLEGDGEVQRGGHPPSGGGDGGDPVPGGGGEQSDPQSAVGAEALLRGEVVGVELARVDPQAAGPRGGVDGHQAAALGRIRRPLGTPDLHHHAGGRLVVGQRVDVDPVPGFGQRVGAELRGDDLGLVEMGRAGGGGRELGGELAEGQVLAPAVDQTEGGRVPERGGPSVPEDHLVVVGQREEVSQPLPQAPRPPT